MKFDTQHIYLNLILLGLLANEKENNYFKSKVIFDIFT